jgi:hypothetical protein
VRVAGAAARVRLALAAALVLASCALARPALRPGGLPSTAGGAAHGSSAVDASGVLDASGALDAGALDA